MVNEQNPPTSSVPQSKRSARKQRREAEFNTIEATFAPKSKLQRTPPQAHASSSTTIATQNTFSPLQDDSSELSLRDTSPTPIPTMSESKGKQSETQVPTLTDLQAHIARQDARIEALITQLELRNSSQRSRMNSNASHSGPTSEHPSNQKRSETLRNDNLRKDSPISTIEIGRMDTARRPNPHRPTFEAGNPSFSPHSSPKLATPYPTTYRLEKIPHLQEKLSDGESLKPQLWKYLMEANLKRYDHLFLDEDHRREHVIANTEGLARNHLQPLLLLQGEAYDAYGLINSAVNITTNPAEQQIATDQYHAIRQKPNQSFWEFYQKFRELANTAGIANSESLRYDLRSKISSRLRLACANEYPKCITVDEYAAVLQTNDADFHATTSRNLSSSSTNDQRSTGSSRRKNKEYSRENQTLTADISQEHIPKRESTFPPRNSTHFRQHTPAAGTTSSYPKESYTRNTPRATTPFRSDTRIAGIEDDNDASEESFSESSQDEEIETRRKATHPELKDHA